MAKSPPASSEEGAGEAAGAPRPGKARATIEFTVVTLLALALGVAFAMFGAPERRAEAPATHASPGQATTMLVDLPPIVTNLGAPQDVWIRLEASIVVEAKGAPPSEALAGEVAEDLLAFLRTTALRDLEGPIGLQNIRQDLGERARIRSGGRVSELVIRTLVVQ